MSKNTLNKK